MKKYLVAWTTIETTGLGDIVKQHWGVYDDKESMMKGCSAITQNPKATEYYSTEIIIHMPFNGH